MQTNANQCKSMQINADPGPTTLHKTRYRYRYISRTTGSPGSASATRRKSCLTLYPALALVSMNITFSSLAFRSPSSVDTCRLSDRSVLFPTVRHTDNKRKAREHIIAVMRTGLRNRIQIGSGFNRVSGFGSGSSGSRRAKITHKKVEKNLFKFMF
jgi:hypothetical protein